MANTRKTLTYEIVISDKGKVQIDGLTKGFVKAETAFKKLGTEVKKTTKEGLNPMIDKTGLAGATIVELGRTISDANYGIRGIANNLSQLSTLFITLISTTGGFMKGLTALKNAFMGPLGIIVLFQIAITLIEKFDMDSRKAARGVNEMSKAIGAAATDLKIFRELLDENRVSSIELDRSVIALNKKYKDLNLQVGENGKLTEKSRKQIDKKILSLERLAKATAQQSMLEEIYVKELQLQLDEQEDLRKREGQDLAVITALRSNFATAGFTALVENFVDEKEVRDNRLEDIREHYRKEREILQRRKDALKQDIVDQGLIDEQTGKQGLFKVASEIEASGLQVMETDDLVTEVLTSNSMARQKNYMTELEALAIFTDGMAYMLGEQSAMGKAFAVANATINTFLAASHVLKDENIPFPLKPIVMAGVIAAGLGNVREILKVDETGGGRLKGGGRAGGSVDVSAPEFNVVGASPESQLAQTVSEQQEKPLRAFVVHKDIKNANSLDRTITETSALG